MEHIYDNIDSVIRWYGATLKIFTKTLSLHIWSIYLKPIFLTFKNNIWDVMGKPLRPRNLHFVAKQKVPTENFIT